MENRRTKVQLFTSYHYWNITFNRYITRFSLFQLYYRILYLVLLLMLRYLRTTLFSFVKKIWLNIRLNVYDLYLYLYQYTCIFYVCSIQLLFMLKQKNLIKLNTFQLAPLLLCLTYENEEKSVHVIVIGTIEKSSYYSSCYTNKNKMHNFGKYKILWINKIGVSSLP